MKLTASLCMRTLLMSLALVGVRSAAAASGINTFSCGDLHPPGQYGPFDYRTVPPDVRHRVEDYHFTPDVETAKKGSTGTTAGGDLDYTLRAFPNSPRALLAVSRYVTLMRTDRPTGLRFPAECYYERAIRFMPDDAMPHLLYAAYLRERKRTSEIRPELDEAERLRGDPSNFDFDYNLGLLYFDVGAYDQSMKAARRAYALGAPFPALEKKLRGVGKWQADAPAAPQAASPAAPPIVSPADPEAPKSDPAKPD